MPFFRGSSRPRDWTHASCASYIGRQVLYHSCHLGSLPFHCCCFFSLPVVSDSLRPHGLQQARPPCLSPSSGVCPSSCSLHRWCHPATSSSDSFFSFCPQSFPVSGTFPMSQLFASHDWMWSQYWSFGFSISPSSEYLGLISLKIDWFDLAVQGAFRSLLQHHSLKASSFWHFAFLTIQLSQP